MSHYLNVFVKANRPQDVHGQLIRVVHHFIKSKGHSVGIDFPYLISQKGVNPELGRIMRIFGSDDALFDIQRSNTIGELLSDELIELSKSVVPENASRAVLKRVRKNDCQMRMRKKGRKVKELEISYAHVRLQSKSTEQSFKISLERIKVDDATDICDESYSSYGLSLNGSSIPSF